MDMQGVSPRIAASSAAFFAPKSLSIWSIIAACAHMSNKVCPSGRPSLYPQVRAAGGNERFPPCYIFSLIAFLVRI